MQVDYINKIIQETELQDKYELVLAKDIELNKKLLKIVNNYCETKTSYVKKCEATAQQLLMTILTDSELKEIHSARYRTKSIESLITKYVRKKAMLPETPGTEYNIEKYRPMNEKNYYKVITDLIGIRILIRYQQQWEMVHHWIWDNFFKGEERYIKNWYEDFPLGETEDFLVEQPKLYLRKQSDESVYQKVGKGIFKPYVLDEGYSSIHYLVWYDGKYVEIQVRTIYDEAWGECTHDLVYKCRNKTRKAELEGLSECLAIQTQAAGMISDMMYEKAKEVPKKKTKDHIIVKKDEGLDKFRFENLQKHIANINDVQEQTSEFNGSIDDLI